MFTLLNLIAILMAVGVLGALVTVDYFYQRKTDPGAYRRRARR
jgi:hypothetical protein